MLLGCLIAAGSALAMPIPKLLPTLDQGAPVVHSLGDGSWLGLWTFAFSDHAGPVVLDTPADLLQGFSGGEILAFHAPDLTPFEFPQTFTRGRHEGALWVRWSPEPGVPLTYSWNYLNRGGVARQGSETMAAVATRPGNPLTTEISEPSALALLMLGLGGLALAVRTRRPTSVADAI